MLSRLPCFKTNAQGLSLLIAVALMLVSGIFQFSPPCYLSETFEDSDIALVEVKEVYRQATFKPVYHQRELALIPPNLGAFSYEWDSIGLFSRMIQPIWLEQDKIRDPPTA